MKQPANLRLRWKFCRRSPSICPWPTWSPSTCLGHAMPHRLVTFGKTVKPTVGYSTFKFFHNKKDGSWQMADTSKNCHYELPHSHTASHYTETESEMSRKQTHVNRYFYIYIYSYIYYSLVFGIHMTTLITQNKCVQRLLGDRRR